MACCYSEDCGEYAVTPMLVTPCLPMKCCEDPPMCYPCLPRCPKGMMYCCEKKPPQTPPRTPAHHEERGGYQSRHHDQSPPQQRRSRSPPPPTRQSSGTAEHCCTTCCHQTCKPVKTKYVIPCYRYEDGRIVRQLPVSAFKRNGMQDQEHSKLLGTTNFITRCPQDVSIECDVCTRPVKVGDPAKVPPCTSRPLGCCLLRKKPIEDNQPTLLMRRACEVAVGARSRKKPFVATSYCTDGDKEERTYHSEDDRGNFCIHFERKKQLCSGLNPCSASSCPSCRPCQPCTASPECEFTDCVRAKAVNPPKTCCYYCT